jgi:hypothetical protein
MATDLFGSGRRTLGTRTILIHGRMMRNRAGVLPQTLLVSFALPYVPEEEQPVEPVQSAGDSRSSHQINDYLLSAITGLTGLASESPKRIRMTSSPKARAAQMDPWKAKNGRRIRLIKKKYRGGGLDAKETAELARLDNEVVEHINHVSPRSSEALKEFEDFVNQLKVEAEKNRQKP